MQNANSCTTMTGRSSRSALHHATRHRKPVSVFLVRDDIDSDLEQLKAVEEFLSMDESSGSQLLTQVERQACDMATD